MRTGIYAGTFDPFTLAHADIMLRSAEHFDKLYVAVLVNTKKHSLFSVCDRTKMITRVIESVGLQPKISAVSFDGMLCDLGKALSACAFVRGLRNTADFESERAMADLNLKLSGGVDTMFFISRPELTSVSSSAVREIGALGGDISAFVPPAILDDIKTVLHA